MGFVSKVQIENTKYPIGASLYGTCDTAANTAAKVVSLEQLDALVTGTTIRIKFLNSNTAANPTLSINGLIPEGGVSANVPIYRHGLITPGTSKTNTWAAGAVVTFTFDTDRWMMDESFDFSQMVNLIYPVGSVYMSVNSTSPATLFGGTWERIQDKFLVSLGSTYTGTGGAAKVRLTMDNIPAHTHEVGAHAHGLNSHTHSVGAHAHGLNNHTHTGPSHTHGLNSHTHGIPALSGTAASAGAHTHPIWYYVSTVPAAIKRAWGFNWGTPGTFTTSQDGIGNDSSGAHTHAVTTTASTTGGSTANTASAGTGNTGGPSTANTANSTAFNSGTPSTANTANSTAFNSGSAGKSTADQFSIIPPYQAVYVWKRTA